jgi:DNA-3-methyladenine glycosylase
MTAGWHAATREELLGLPVEVAPLLLNGVLTTLIDGEEVAVRLTEVEAYHGLGTGEVHDPGSHARMGRTVRNATMWGEPGHLYVYLSHGIHSCVNVVCGPEGAAGGVLLRAGEIVRGADVARRRRRARGVVRTDASATRSGCAIPCTTASTS